MPVPPKWFVVFFVLAVTACAGRNQTGVMYVPKPVPPPTAANASAGFLFENDKQASFRLSRVVVSLSRGDTIAHFPIKYREKWNRKDRCNYYYGKDSKLEWGAGQVEFGDWSSELGQIFFDAMKARGANVVGNPSKLFRVDESAQAAEFLVGGRITKISGNICDVHSRQRIPTGASYGEFGIAVDWEVYSALNQRVEYKFSTQGYGETHHGQLNGRKITLLNAFANAVENAAEDEGFQKILTRKTESADATPPVHERLSVAGEALYRTPLSKHIGKIRAAAVTIDLGQGHGSGFLISRDGYLLTNAHVVGDGERVPVVFRGGVRVQGRVVRVIKERDVALVKVPVSAEYILPIAQNEAPAVSDTVYALGTPMSRGLTASLTKGIVSGYRNFEGDLRIQADVPISPGNSGGPLLNEQGNVVGISVSHVIGGNSLDFFIPIDDALKKLNLSVEVE